jgi:hypothetical protein
MSISGTTFNNDWATGNHIDFGPGTGGLEDVFKSDYTIAVLARLVEPNFGLFGGYEDEEAATPLRQWFQANNSGGRLFGNGDFSDGYPSSGELPGGLDDNVWRWHGHSKQSGSTHYRMHYADLATLTWSQGESSGAANHSDPSGTAQLFSTWAIYGMGFNEGAQAYICIWPTALTDLQIRDSCTQSAADLLSQSPPIGMWSFKESEVAGTIVDLTGNGADEISRQNITASADPDDFDFTLAPPFQGGMFLPFFS